MNERTLKALLASVEHWHENYFKAGNGNLAWSDVSGSECALCAEFYTNDKCDGCPVQEATGQTRCFDTPHDVVCEALNEEWIPAADVQAAVLDEIDFLVDLIPDPPGDDSQDQFIADSVGLPLVDGPTLGAWFANMLRET